MAVFRAFQAVRPTPDKASDVAALPYDVMNSEEARIEVDGKPLSFLHVDKAEIDLDKSVDAYDGQVYLKARANLDFLMKSACIKEKSPCFYIYRQTMNGRSQTGLVGTASIDDYIENRIKKHEFTREDKEQDRIKHVDVCDANTGPIFLAYRSNAEIEAIVRSWQSSHTPEYDFTSAGDVGNTVWVIDDSEVCAHISKAFASIDSLYIADGHHRCASAVKVGLKRRQSHPGYTGSEEFNFFLCVAFPDRELAIMDYNRVIADFGGYSADDLLEKLNERFILEKAPFSPYKPEARHCFGFYIEGRWYKLTAKVDTYDENDPVGCLDVSILQRNCISPIFGIDDPRTDKRIDFVGGIRGLGELERRAANDMAVAFSMYPTSLDELMAIADAGKVMPPKSTWFEPKLLSGLFIHPLS